jgi:hypothetical protein
MGRWPHNTVLLKEKSVNILITGSRQFTNVEVMRAVLIEVPRDALIIHGGADGADVLSSVIMYDLEFQRPPHVVRPDYNYWIDYYTNKIAVKSGQPYGPKLGRKLGGLRAPQHRNEWMLDGKVNEEGSSDPSLVPDLVLAFFISEEETGGTTHCVREARKRQIPIVSFNSMMLAEEAVARLRSVHFF